MDSSVEHATEPDFGEAAAWLPADHAGALPAVASHDLVPMSVGAVMALHSVDQQTATSALDKAAEDFQVSVSAVAHALLTLVSGTDEQFGAIAGGAAIQLLVRDFTSSS